MSIAKSTQEANIHIVLGKMISTIGAYMQNGMSTITDGQLGLCSAPNRHKCIKTLLAINVLEDIGDNKFGIIAARHATGENTKI